MFDCSAENPALLGAVQILLTQKLIWRCSTTIYSYGFSLEQNQRSEARNFLKWTDERRYEENSIVEQKIN
jgi:hypothetical protein